MDEHKAHDIVVCVGLIHEDSETQLLNGRAQGTRHCHRAFVEGDNPPLARLNFGLRQGVFLKRRPRRISLLVFTASFTHVTASV
jgi:hypothetical protein